MLPTGITKLVWENRAELASMNAAFNILTPEDVKEFSLDLAPPHPDTMKVL